MKRHACLHIGGDISSYNDFDGLGQISISININIDRHGRHGRISMVMALLNLTDERQMYFHSRPRSRGGRYHNMVDGWCKYGVLMFWREEERNIKFDAFLWREERWNIKFDAFFWREEVYSVLTQHSRHSTLHNRRTIFT
jgi:hypothetical protein